MRYTYAALAAGLFAAFGADEARAGLEICNETPYKQSVSIGYHGAEGLASEGWWQIDPQGCVTLIEGDLQERFFYYRALSEAGVLQGGDFAFCTTPEAYTIIGNGNCEARGYEPGEFAMIDTGPTALDFTFTLTSRGNTEEEGGLTFCNETDDIQSVSVGYLEGEDWASSGWWNIDPGACQATLTGPLANQFFYYRAEVNGGPFDGENYEFCTTPESYTIIGDTDCEARGYETEDFAEIDIGEGNRAYTATLVDPNPRPAPSGSAPDTGKAAPDSSGTGFPTFERKGAPRPGE